MCSLKWNCSFSLQKLMHSCSKLFVSNDSKPKISSTPITFVSPVAPEPMPRDRLTLIFWMSQSNSLPYMVLHMASRASPACSLL